MEFLELMMVLVAMVLMIKKPQEEKLAFNLVLSAWILMVFIYVGHKSGAFLTSINL